mmetsp:Transcript_5427/g.17122  ORF Transcript_5427/g.17122 Transcript_5427/m.17122 type:complete len:293 (+) Transcript_5427:948-1826(+)
MEVEYAHVNGFTSGGEGGNPAGVVLDEPALGLDDARRQQIAAGIGFSETVFARFEGDRLRLRYFTPAGEVDLCGHATVASLGYLHETGVVKAPRGTILTLAGVIAYEIAEETVFMEQLPAAVDSPLADDVNAELAAALGGRLSPYFAPRVASTGLRDALVAVDDAAALVEMAPDFPRVAELSKRLDTVGAHVFAAADARLAAASDRPIAVRNFAPLHGIDEESATGTSNCALACTLRDAGLLPGGREYIFAQGDRMGAPSRIVVRVPTDVTERPWVGGRFATVAVTQMTTPL